MTHHLPETPCPRFTFRLTALLLLGQLSSGPPEITVQPGQDPPVQWTSEYGFTRSAVVFSGYTCWNWNTAMQMIWLRRSATA